MAGQWTSMDTWTTIDAISYFSFLISFVARMTCIDIYRRYKTEETQIAFSTIIQEFFSHATLFNGTYNLLDTTDRNCPLYFDTKYEPDYQFRSKSNNTDLDEEKNQEVFTHMRNAQYCYVITFVLFCVKTLELCTGKTILLTGLLAKLANMALTILIVFLKLRKIWARKLKLWSA